MTQPNVRSASAEAAAEFTRHRRIQWTQPKSPPAAQVAKNNVGNGRYEIDQFTNRHFFASVIVYRFTKTLITLSMIAIHQL